MYEYKIVKIRGIRKAEELMNRFANDGWRVVSNAVDFKWGDIYYITFERESS